MAVNTLSVEEITRSGINLADTGSLSATDTYKFLNNGRTFLHFKKSGAGACTVTIVTQSTEDGLAVGDRTVSVPATTGDVMVGPFPREIYNDSSGFCTFSLSEITGLTVAVATIP